MKIEEDVQCEYCDAEFFIQYDEDAKLSCCPFCGESLPTNAEDEEDY